MQLKQYLESKNSLSSFSATQSEIGGNIVFGNSGKRGEKKKFTLGLDSFIMILKDINKNLNSFQSHKDYVEKDWRDLGSEFYSDEPANALSTVQTKPLFSTVSKIICWANMPDFEKNNFDQRMEISDESLKKAISKLEELALKFKPKNIERKINFSENLFDIYKFFHEDCQNANLSISENACLRFIASILTKPFVILTGLSGSGKTKLAQAFAIWICENENQYCMVPVGADWTNREPLLGFPNALQPEKYIKPDNGVLDLIIEADKNGEKPYFLILDEMNLSHVERYFADFLSVMESDENILLHEGTEPWVGVPAKIGIPKNLFIVGTVNVDETTYMFSPKVLDRANVIEFRVTKEEMKNFLSNGNHLDLESIKSNGSNMALDFVKTAKDKVSAENNEELQNTLLDFFIELKKSGAEFGYRSASEIMRFSAVVKKLDSGWDESEIIDAAIMQKLLPKVHGSRRKLEPVLKTLGNLCLNNGHKFDELISPKAVVEYDNKEIIKYPVSLEKIIRMFHGLQDNGFTSYAEA